MEKVHLFLAMIAFNVAMGALFIISNFHLWDAVNPLDYTSPNWGPMNIVYVPRFFVDGQFVLEQMIVVLFNYPFWLFWVAMVGNVLFAVLILKSKQTAPGKSPAPND